MRHTAAKSSAVVARYDIMYLNHCVRTARALDQPSREGYSGYYRYRCHTDSDTVMRVGQRRALSKAQMPVVAACFLVDRTSPLSQIHLQQTSAEAEREARKAAARMASGQNGASAEKRSRT